VGLGRKADLDPPYCKPGVFSPWGWNNIAQVNAQWVVVPLTHLLSSGKSSHFSPKKPPWTILPGNREFGGEVISMIA
jgi:hypothetical protein